MGYTQDLNERIERYHRSVNKYLLVQQTVQTVLHYIEKEITTLALNLLKNPEAFGMQLYEIFLVEHDKRHVLKHSVE